jgi:hypothetical protein
MHKDVQNVILQKLCFKEHVGDFEYLFFIGDRFIFLIK